MSEGRIVAFDPRPTASDKARTSASGFSQSLSININKFEREGGPYLFPRSDRLIPLPIAGRDRRCPCAIAASPAPQYSRRRISGFRFSNSDRSPSARRSAMGSSVPSEPRADHGSPSRSWFPSRKADGRYRGCDLDRRKVSVL